MIISVQINQRYLLVLSNDIGVIKELDDWMRDTKIGWETQLTTPNQKW